MLNFSSTCVIVKNCSIATENDGFGNEVLFVSNGGILNMYVI